MTVWEGIPPPPPRFPLSGNDIKSCLRDASKALFDIVGTKQRTKWSICYAKLCHTQGTSALTKTSRGVIMTLPLHCFNRPCLRMTVVNRNAWKWIAKVVSIDVTIFKQDHIWLCTCVADPPKKTLFYGVIAPLLEYPKWKSVWFFCCFWPRQTNKKW